MSHLFDNNYILRNKDSFSKLCESREEIIEKKKQQDSLIPKDEIDDPDVEELLETIEELSRIDFNVEILDESVKTKLNDVKQTIKKVENKIDSAFDRKVKAIMQDAKNETEERIVSRTLPKLTSMLKTGGLVGGALAVFNPVTVAAGALVTMAIKKNFSMKSKKRILNELKLEAEIIEEKIKDADSEGNKQAKYELMRRRSDINRAIDRIRYNIK